MNEEEKKIPTEEETVTEEVKEPAKEKKCKTKKIQEELEKAQAEAEDFKRKWYSVTAEYENYRRRTQAQSAQRYQEGRNDVISALFPVGDNLERALASCTDENTRQGVDMILKSFKKVLEGEGVEEIETSLHIYPNPVNDKLYIETQTLTQTLNIEIYDIYGRCQQLSAVSCQSSVIDLSNLKSGIYFVKINTEEGNIVKRIIKQ